MELKVAPIVKSFFHAGVCVFRLETTLLTLRRRQLTYIIGHNGSGKSLFASLVCGEGDRSASGAHCVFDTEPQQPAKGALIRQRPEENVCLDLSVEENVVLRLASTPTMGQLLTWPPPISAEFNRGLLSRLRDRRGVDASRLSAGERQILSFECARLGRADLYILDEFTSALDPAAKQDILPEVREMGDAAVAIISHDVDEVQENADRIIAFCNGKIVLDRLRPKPGWKRGHIRELASGIIRPETLALTA